MILSQQLHIIVMACKPELLAIAENEAKKPLAIDKWAPIQIIGHLIDSAANNHARFLKATLQESIIFPGYAQMEWVNNQGYLSADWENTVLLWSHYNLHLAHFFGQIPEETLMRPRKEHDFAGLTHGYIMDENPNSLFHLIKDYIGHLEHHLGQILLDYVPVVKGK